MLLIWCTFVRPPIRLPVIYTIIFMFIYNKKNIKFVVESIYNNVSVVFIFNFFIFNVCKNAKNKHKHLFKHKLMTAQNIIRVKPDSFCNYYYF